MTHQSTPTIQHRSDTGVTFGVLAYAWWGFVPLYWPLLEPSRPLESLSHRVVWSLVFVAGLLTVTRTWRSFLCLLRRPRLMALLLCASVMIAINWGMFIYGVDTNRVLEVSLGYFMNPLVTVMLGVFVLGERLRQLQWVAVGMGMIAVLVLALDYARVPLIALSLAFSFAIYGFVKKTVNLGTIESLATETFLLTPFALAYLLWLASQGTLVFGHHGWGNALLLMGTGVVTAVPLLLFGAAATRLSLVTLGLLQYLGPALQFCIALFVFGESMTPARWCGFALVWVALVLFSIDALRQRNRALTHP